MSEKDKNTKDLSWVGEVMQMPPTPLELSKFDEFLEGERRVWAEYYGEEQSEAAVLLFAASNILDFVLLPLQLLERRIKDSTGFEARPSISLEIRHAKECLRRLENIKHWNLHNLSDLEKNLGVTTRTLHRYIDEGLLKAKKIGGTWWITPENFNEFLTTYSKVGRKGKKGSSEKGGE